MSDDLEARRLARESARPDAPPRRATQAELASAATRHSSAAGEAGNRAGLPTPLTAAELEAGQGYGVGITDVDCTPRPRYGESRERFEARMRSYGVEVETLKTDIRVRNRRNAVKSIERADGVLVYWTQCPCGWCGLRVEDPEVARREYDAHACAAESIGDDAVSRAQAHAGKATLPPKRERAVLQPSLPSQGTPEQQSGDVRPDQHVVMAGANPAPGTDDAETRFALLELDGKPK